MLSIQGLEVRYGAIQALRRIDLELAAGEIVAVIGSNGAGKTTLLQSILGLVRPDKGVITFDGKPITQLSASRTANLGISLVPEGREVFGTLTVLENLRLGLKNKIGSTSKEQFERELASIYERFPRLYERRDQQAMTLSGGEQQMLVLSRAMISKPKLLLLDEPSLGLAPIIVSDIFASIQELAKGGTAVLLVEQMAHKALSIASRGYVIDNGRVAFQGKSSDLLQDQRMIKAYLGVH
ncbi:branched-chain amino acid transport system ATP-binding protein [Paenibacillus phyllosphaerae]|uniref:Branched-chain amino acid transport system ATP-binding protein n=1 Tax=Paenibacillus phyllosphaerae TaxID=274593 RepID=A0A7W5B3Z3_9BACL|nr:branched-chain amino acid transport system ATP-binding protein [Paenibacillus phyllosphaerae]